MVSIHSSKFRLFIFCLTFAALFCSCKKKGQIAGRVINGINYEPVAGIQVILNEDYFDFFAIRNGGGTIGSSTTDESGAFAMNYKAKKGKRFKLSLQINHSLWYTIDTVPDYRVAYASVSPMYVNNGQPSSDPDFINLNIYPLSRVKIVSNSSGPMQEGDYFFVYAYGPTGDSMFVHSVYGSETPNYQYVEVASNGIIPIKYFSRKSMITSTGSDTIHVKPFEKTTFHINY